MNAQVEKFLEEQAKKSSEAKQKQREAFLIANGLFEKEYRPRDKAHKNSTEWPCWDPVAHMYYKSVPLELTEEEWAQVEKACEKDKNGIASLLKWLASSVYVFAFIAGIALGRDVYGNSSFGLCLLYWVAGLFSGSLLLGFSEVVRLLHEIRQK